MKKIIAFLMVFSICLVCFGTYGFESADICTDEACGHDHSGHDHSGHVAFAAGDSDIEGGDPEPVLWAKIVSQTYEKYSNGDYFVVVLDIGVANFDTQISGAVIEIEENNSNVTFNRPQVSGTLFGTEVNTISSTRNVRLTIDHATTNTGRLTISYPIIRVSSRYNNTITVTGYAAAPGTMISVDEMIGSLSIYVCEHAHYDYKTIKEPTCSSSGLRAYVCQACGMTHPTEPNSTIPPKGHTFDYSTHYYENIYGYIAPTCKQPGYGAFECSVCKIIDPSVAPIIDHSWGNRYQENGVWKEKCSMCGTVRNADNQCSHSLNAYTYVSTLTPSTCTTKGTAVYRCPSCGVTDIRELDDLAKHTPGTWSTVRAATCSVAGLKKSTCSVCSMEFTEEIPKTSHDYSTWTTTTQATCSSNGERTRTCSICNDVQKEAIEKTGHDFGTWRTVTEATCVEAGLQERVCTVCNQKDTRRTEILPHSFNNWTVSLAPTCAAAGSEQRSCTVCGKVEARAIAIASDAHKYGDWRIVSARTCTTDGVKERTCEYCSYVDRVADSCIGHTFGNWETKGKITSRTCPCGYSESIKKVKGGVEKTLTCLDGTLKITGATASQDVVFEVSPMSLDQESYYKQYLPFEKAYTYTIYVDGVKSAITADMTLGITMDAGLKDNEISVVSLRGTSFFTVAEFERKGLDLTLSGADLLGTESLFITKGPVISPNIALPIVIAVLTLVIAGAAVYVIMSKSKSKTQMF